MSESELELYEQDDIGLESDDSRDERRGGHRFGRLGGESDDDASQASGAEDDVPADVTDEDYRILRATVVDIVSALGGLEDVLVDGVVEAHYSIGDDVLRCLRDLRTLWRQDEDDASRLIPRIYAEVNVLEKGLVPLLLKAVGLGERGTKIALACTDLITSLTWPIDALAELRAAKEQNEDAAQMARLAKLTVLERALTSYKAAILRTRSGETHGSEHDVLQTVMLHILLPSLSKPRPLRTERDTGTISMCLHLFRNLLAIKDPLSSSLSSNETIAASRLQSDLVVALDKAHILDTLLMLASSSETRELDPWNAVTAECVYQIFSGTKAVLLVPGSDQAPVASEPEVPGGAPAAAPRKPRPASASALASSLNAEASQRRAALMQNGPTRHSRFGTALTFTGTDGRRRVSRNQASLRKTAEQLTEEAAAKQKRRNMRRKAIREKGAARLKTDWTKEARAVLTRWAAEFLRVGFEPLTRSVLQDVRKENAKVGNVDEARVRIMQLAVFFLDYFLLQRAASAQQASTARKAQQEQAKAAETRRVDKGKGRAIDPPEQSSPAGDATAAPAPAAVAPAVPDAQPETAAKNEWTFALVGFWLEPWAFKMATIRSEFALEAREWLEYVTAVQLWTVLLRLVDSMAHSGDATQQDVAEGLQAQLYYEKNTLDMCQRIARSYKSQSFSCLEAVIGFAHTMPRMLERYSSNKEHLFIRARARVKRAKARGGADEADLAEMQQDANERAEATYQERRFEFARFQNELCKPEVADASLNYLARWRDFSMPAEQLASIVGIMHRIAIKAGRADLFFPYDVRQTLRALLSSPMMPSLEPVAPTPSRDAKKLIEYILKRYEKLTPEQQTKFAMGKGRTRDVKAKKMPREIHVSPTRGHVGDVGIAVGLLAGLGKVRNIMWVKEALELASAERTEIVLSTDGAAARARSEERDEWDDSDRRRAPQSALDSNHLPSDEAVAKFTSFIMAYPNPEVATDGCMLPELKMLCRLVGLESESTGEDKMRWLVPAEIPPAHLDAEVAYIEEFMRSPYDTEGAELRSFVRVVPKARAKKTPAEKDADEEDPSGYDTYGSGVVSDNDDGTGAQTAARSRKEAAAELRKSRKRNRGGAAPRPRKKKAGPAWTAGDFIEDSDEEMAQAQAILDARATAALAAEANASRAAAADSDSDSGSSASTRRRARGPARPRPTALARIDGTHVSPARSTPSRAGSTPPTSSPARDSPAPAKTRKLRPSGGLFFGGQDSDEEEDAAMSDAELRAESPSPAVRNATQAKRPAMLESDDEVEAQQSAPTTQLAKRRRAAVLDSDDE